MDLIAQIIGYTVLSAGAFVLVIWTVALVLWKLDGGEG